jgi:Na+/H+-dicarboxylate symporter
MLRTAVNITGDAACAAIVDRFRESAAPSGKSNDLNTTNH